MADMDGSDARQLAAATTEIAWYDWSPDDRQVVATWAVGGHDALSVIDVDSGKTHTFDLRIAVHEPVWRPNGHEIVFRGEGDGATDGLYLVRADGTGLRPILATTSGGEEDWRRPTLSPDGRQIAFDRWNDGRYRGRIHVVDVDSGRDTRLAIDNDSVGTTAGQPVWSPDGSRLAFLWFEPGNAGGFQVAVGPATGGRAVTIGPEHQGDLRLTFSPDGRQILAGHLEDGSTWLYDADTVDGHRVDWPPDGWTWQRLAR